MTADTGEERVDWIDDQGDVVEVVSRSRLRAENLRHRSVAVIVTTTAGRLVVQRRADTKDVYPGWWDIGAGGVVTSGEDLAVAARRELAEELGIDASPEYVTVERFENDLAREVCSVFRLVHDGPFHPADGEAAEIRTVDPDEFADLSARAPFLPGSLAMLLPHVPEFLAAG